MAKKMKFADFGSNLKDFALDADPEGNKSGKTEEVSAPPAKADRKPSNTSRKKKVLEDLNCYQISTYVDKKTFELFQNELKKEDRSPAALARVIIKKHYGLT